MILISVCVCVYALYACFCADLLNLHCYRLCTTTYKTYIVTGYVPLLIKLTLLQVMYLPWFSTGMHKCSLRPLSLFEMKMLLNVRFSCGIFLQFHNILYAMTTPFDTKKIFPILHLALFTTGYGHSHTGIWMLYYENFIPRFTHVPVILCNIV